MKRRLELCLNKSLVHSFVRSLVRSHVGSLIPGRTFMLRGRGAGSPSHDAVRHSSREVSQM